MTWAELLALEPELAVLHRELSAIKDDGRGDYFCANEVWYGYGSRHRPGYKTRLCELVGWCAPRHVLPELRTMAAYDLAYDTLYNLLPACRNCGCA